MNRIGDDFYFKVHDHKVTFTAAYLKKIFAISVWLSKRYNIKQEHANYDMGTVNEDILNNTITVKIGFNEKK